jgi:hypothetical protein
MLLEVGLEAPKDLKQLSVAQLDGLSCSARGGARLLLSGLSSAQCCRCWQMVPPHLLLQLILLLLSCQLG